MATRSTFRLFASSAELSKAPSGFVNFQIYPYAVRGGAQRVSITRGEWRAEEVIDQPRTISVPYVRDNWKGADLQAMTITMRTCLMPFHRMRSNPLPAICANWQSALPQLV